MAFIRSASAASWVSVAASRPGHCVPMSRTCIVPPVGTADDFGGAEVAEPHAARQSARTAMIATGSSRFLIFLPPQPNFRAVLDGRPIITITLRFDDDHATEDMPRIRCPAGSREA